MQVLRLLLCLILLLTTISIAFGAPTPAGTVIQNQASATYRTLDGQLQTVTSNLVETVINQVPGLELTADQTLNVLAGASVSFPHRLSNTGNGNDRYTLQAGNVGSDDFDLSSLVIYADSNADGIADNSVPITESPWLSAGADFHMVITGIAPQNAIAGQSSVINLVAKSNFDSSLSQINTDKAVLHDGSIVTIAKSINESHGASPSGPYIITLDYSNVGSATATQVALIDALPAGMSYVPGSATWSETGTSLTDSDPTDSHSGSTGSLIYCAYHNSCTGLPEADADIDSDSSNQVTAIISSVPAGASGQISFSIEIDAQLVADTLLNTAELEYLSAGSTSGRINSNATRFNVLSGTGVVANGSKATSINGMDEPVYQQSIAQGTDVNYENIIWNTGNVLDTFNIEVDNLNSSFPAGTFFQLFRTDGTPLLDTNSDGSVDTGPIQPGDFSIVVLRLSLPEGSAGNNSGQGYDITKTARSVTNAATFDSITDHLDEIVANQVDLTNQAPAGSPGALGTGPGPEPTPVSSVTTDQNGNANFDLHIRHQGFEADTYDLRAFSSATGAPLPTGWQVVFRDAMSSVVLTNTGLLASGESKHVIATLTLDAATTPTVQSVFFEARSPRTTAHDLKHDAVIVEETEGISLTPNLTAQLQPGGSVVYRHTLSNTGTSSVADLALATGDSETGWTSLIYSDSNNDNLLTAEDNLLTGLVSLNSGESQTLFVKVFAPATAKTLEENTTTLTAQWSGSASSVSVTDVSTVNKSHVAIRKEQVPDTGCDGTPDPGLDFSPGHIEVAPGNNCIIYRLTATNHGLEPSYNVTIHDYTPPFTRYRETATCSRSPCWVSEPETDETGTISAETDQLLPGDGFYLEFSVSVE